MMVIDNKLEGSVSKLLAAKQCKCKDWLHHVIKHSIPWSV